jgi:hypothetical protein
MNFAEYLPSAQLFNHVVVRVRLEGATYWLDPTMQLQGGTLEQIALLHTGWALPLIAGTTGLERLPSLAPVQHIHCEDSCKFGPNVDSVAILDRRIDFESWTANSLRNRLAGEGTAKLSAQLLQELKRTWPDVVEKAPLAIQDDFKNNRLSVLCSFEVRNCWKRGDPNGRVGFDIADPFLGNELAPLKDPRRTGEIFLGRPRKATWRARLQMPRKWQGTGWRHALCEAYINFKSELTIGAEAVVVEREVEIGAWSVGPEKAQQYAQIVDRLRANVITLWARAELEGAVHPIGTAQQQRKTRSPSPWLALLFLPALIGGLNALNSSQHPTISSSFPNTTTAYTSDFLPQPQAHVNRFDRLVDSSLATCIETGRDRVAAFLRNGCLRAAKIRLLRPSAGEPYEITISPGAISYVYFMDPSDTSGGMAACPEADQIVESQSGLSWRLRGTSYMCQHSLR